MFLKKEVVLQSHDNSIFIHLTHKTMALQDTIIALEKEALDQWANGNPAGYFTTHGADDMICFDDIGAQNGISGLHNIKQYGQKLNAMIPPHKYEMVGIHVQQYGDTAILSFQYHPFSLDGQPQTKWRASVVYVSLEGTWKMVHTQWVMMKGQNS